jgi:predicted nucleotidyltransferase
MPASHHDCSVVTSLANRVARQFASLDQVEAVALSGSQTSELHDSNSDIDLYVYVTSLVPLEVRRRIADGAERAEIGNEYWESGDEWIDRETGIAIDVMFRHVTWIEEQLDRILRQHKAAVGYSTCFWYNVRYSQVLFDRHGWLNNLKSSSDQSYPPELKQAIIAKNFPLLRQNLSSYLRQIELAIARNDPVSVNHRITALLASYFDILFAVNELPHPGEKRLIPHALAQCPKLPPAMPETIEDLLASSQADHARTLSNLHLLIDGLEDLLASEGLRKSEVAK